MVDGNQVDALVVDRTQEGKVVHDCQGGVGDVERRMVEGPGVGEAIRNGYN